MSHLHIPDGVLPLWLVAAGWLMVAAILLLVLRYLGGTERGRQLPLLGVMAAVMLVGMSTEIVPIGYHANLSVLAGIVLGPALGFLAALIVNLILALFGHGGITVVGLNSLVVGSEAAAGYFLFRGARALLSRGNRSPAMAAAVATAMALILSTALMIALVGLSNMGPSTHLVVSSESLTFRNPLEHGLVASELAADGPRHEAVASAPSLDLASFAKLVLALGLVGWAVEALLTGAIVGFVSRVRPDLVSRGSRAFSPPMGSLPPQGAGSEAGTALPEREEPRRLGGRAG